MDKKILAFLLGTRRKRFTATVDPAVIAVLVSHARTLSRTVRFSRTCIGYINKSVVRSGERVVRFEMRCRYRYRVHYDPFVRFVVGTRSPARGYKFAREPINQWCDADGTAHIVGVVTGDGRFRVEAWSTARPGTVLGYVETVPHAESVTICLDPFGPPLFGALYVTSRRGADDTFYRDIQVSDDCEAKLEISPV